MAQQGETQHNANLVLSLTQRSKEENILRFNNKGRKRYATLKHLLNQYKSALKKEGRRTTRRRINAGLTPTTAVAVVMAGTETAITDADGASGGTHTNRVTTATGSQRPDGADSGDTSRIKEDITAEGSG